MSLESKIFAKQQEITDRINKILISNGLERQVLNIEVTLGSNIAILADFLPIQTINEIFQEVKGLSCCCFGGSKGLNVIIQLNMSEKWDET